jgi:hypothetical protein
MPDYTFYTESFHGTLIPEESFGIWAGRAGYKLDALTFARHRDEMLPAWIQTRVNLALCAIAELLYSRETGGAADAAAPAAGIVEERVGSHTVKYRDAISAEQALAAQIRSLASAYLLPTGLLNRASRIVD